ncbi:MAG: M20/M25/M40 family metallo-hydrolase [Terriglobales bacterium]
MRVLLVIGRQAPPTKARAMQGFRKLFISAVFTIALSFAPGSHTFRVEQVQAAPFDDTTATSVKGQTGRLPAMPSDAIPEARMRRYQDLAVRWMQEYLRIDTTNPPGNEIQAAGWFKRIFDQEGIENRMFVYAPGRANIWARIPARRAAKRPIILLNHMDVVSSNPAKWVAPPFSGATVDGAMYGRGAEDMKNEGLAQLMVMVMLKRERPAMDRDVIFLATADEEVEATGTDWMIANQRELLGNAEYLITEGGDNVEEEGQTRYVGVSVAEKAPLWLRVVAHGQPGHGSRPIEDSAPNRLLRALDRILNYRPEPQVQPLVAELLREVAPYQSGDRAAQFRNIRQALQDKSFRESVEDDDSLNYLLRDTISLTMMGGSQQTNVIPSEAWAHLDVRLLPGVDPQAFLETMRQVVADPNVTIEPLDGFVRANSSPIDSELFAAIRRVAARYFPNAPVLPRLASGYNESQRYRPLGMVCYGFSPYATTRDEGGTEHGDNERIRVEQLRRGFRVLYDLVLSIRQSRFGTGL